MIEHRASHTMTVGNQEMIELHEQGKLKPEELHASYHMLHHTMNVGNFSATFLDKLTKSVIPAEKLKPYELLHPKLKDS